MRKTLNVVLAMAVTAAPLYADTVPTKKAKQEATVVETRLMTLGATPETAQRQTADLTRAEARFFAQDADRIQVAGMQQDFFNGQSVNLWYESVAGALMLMVGFGAGYYMVHNRE